MKGKEFEIGSKIHIICLKNASLVLTQMESKNNEIQDLRAKMAKMEESQIV